MRIDATDLSSRSEAEASENTAPTRDGSVPLAVWGLTGAVALGLSRGRSRTGLGRGTHGQALVPSVLSMSLRHQVDSPIVDVYDGGLTASGDPGGGWGQVDHTDDPSYGVDKQGAWNAPSRGVQGQAARADGRAAIAYFKARGWEMSANLLDHYLDHTGEGAAVGDTYNLSESEVDGLGRDAYNGGYGPSVRSLPDDLALARAEAVRDSEEYFRKYPHDNTFEADTPWQVYAGSQPDHIYALGQYSAKIRTVVERQPDGSKVVRQQFWVYDWTDYDPQSDTMTSLGAALSQNPVDTVKFTIIDELWSLNRIGWAHNFNTHGTSSVQTWRV
ncbi:hypothetical protein [Gordonia malaquae]|uniref:hypothetical protein n=1 Tax=Gordonia malaquae TaxID=410332 RepID=UPI0030FDF7E8